ncbi:MAG: GNAT family N-acetyltransferase [Armatimonadetes bacterium]|nr:GNAT family N-acetyltransferase [Armatimonadota bacterium]
MSEDVASCVEVVEYSPERAADLLKVRNAIFPPLTLDQWLETTASFTGPIAYLGSEPVGAIPMDVREFQVAPGKIVRVAQENAVGVREDLRSRGIGSKMIEAAADFLAGRCEMLTVYRGAERTRGYKFYERTGHADLVYLRALTWEQPSGEVRDVAIGGIDQIDAEQDELLRVFSIAYGDYGGFPPRQQGYWARQLRSHIYVVLPHEFILLRYPAEGPMQGYLIAGWRSGDQWQPAKIEILEFVALNDNAASHLLLALGAHAEKAGRGIQVFAGWEHPLLFVLRRFGFVEGERYFMLMGRPIAPQRLLEKAAATLEPLAELAIDVWTPTTDYTLYAGPNAKRRITLEAKDWVIARLLSRRLDVVSAVEHDLLSIRNGLRRDVLALADALPYTKWVYHGIDYI